MLWDAQKGAHCCKVCGNEVSGQRYNVVEHGRSVREGVYESTD